MTKKREPLDLVGRLASRLNLSEDGGRDIAAAAPAAPTIAMRAAVSAPPPSMPTGPEPRIVGRQPTSRIEPTLVRGGSGAGAPALEREPRPALKPASEEKPSIAIPAAASLAAELPQDAISHGTSPHEPMPHDAPVHRAFEPSQRSAEPAAIGVLELPRPQETLPVVPATATAVDPETEAQSRKQVDFDLVRLHKEGFLTPQNQRSLIAEEYRIIKRPLLRAAFDHADDPRNLNHVVMITSARPSEGKTFTAINLAMSVATERDLFVLLVDCDIRRMGLSKKLGVADRKGLMDVLVDPTSSVADVILRTNIPNLAIIPSGQPVEAATERFASAKMTALVDDIASRYSDRFIIFDAPPVLASSEPGVLAVHVGQTVMVVHANETSKRAIAQSIPLINGCPNVHFVLNRVSLAAGPDRFGYYGTY